MATRRRQASSLGEHSYEAVVSRELGRVLVVIWPWFGWVGTMCIALIIHGVFPGTATAVGVGVSGTLLSLHAMHLTRHRQHPLGRWLAAVTVVASFGWVAVCTALGIHQPETAVWLVGGGSAALAWSMWLHIHESNDEAGLRDLVAAAEAVGHPGWRFSKIVRAPRKTMAVVRHTKGMVTADVIKSAGQIESMSGLPPGTLSVTQNKDNASWSNMVISDPRVLHSPIPWPGPSHPMASIAEPLRQGKWQDGDDIELTVVNYHVQAMGCTGAGKTMGYGYTELAETVTRRDAGVLAADITKGSQFLGPMRPALHKFTTDPSDTLKMMAGIHRAVRARTDHLGRKGLGNWTPDCGLTHLTVWLEEVPDIAELLEDQHMLDDWISDIRAGRSAGIRWVLSLQRSDWTQLPTLVRGQIGKICMGVLNSDDAKFGLSAVQQEGDCNPELWGSSEPGMAYIDVPPVDKTHKVMPGRFYYWGNDTRRIAAHSMEFPAEARPLDAITTECLYEPPRRAARPAPRRHTDQPAPAQRLAAVPDDGEDDEMDDIDTGQEREPVEEIDVAAAEENSWPLGSGELAPRLDQAEAEREFKNQLLDWKMAGHVEFSVSDLVDLLDKVGRSRAWAYGMLAELESNGSLVRRRQPGGQPDTWEIQSVA